MYLILFLFFFSLPVFAEVTRTDVDYTETEQGKDLNQAEEQDQDDSEEMQMRKIPVSNYLGFVTELVRVHWLLGAPEKMCPASFDLRNLLTSLLKHHTLYYGIRINKSRFAVCPGIGVGSICYVFPYYKEASKRIFYSLYQISQDQTTIRKANELIGGGTNIQNDDVSRSILAIQYLSFLLELRFNSDLEDAKDKFFIAMGVRTLVRIGSTITINYKEFNESKLCRNSGSFNLHRWLFGGQLRVGYKRFGIEGRYIFNSLFSHEKGPDKVSMHPMDISIVVDLI